MDPQKPLAPSSSPEGEDTNMPTGEASPSSGMFNTNTSPNPVDSVGPSSTTPPAEPAVTSWSVDRPADVTPDLATTNPSTVSRPSDTSPSYANGPVETSTGPAPLNERVAASELFSSPATGAAGVTGGAPRGRKKGLVWGLVIAGAVLLLGGGGAAAYFGYYLPHQPDNILKSALVKSFSSGSIKSESFDGKLTYANDDDDLDLTGTIKGKANTDGAFELRADVDVLVTKVTLDLRSADGSSYYLKLGGLSGLPALLAASDDPTVQGYASLIAGLDEQWFVINQSLLKQLGADMDTMKLSEADKQKLSDIYTKHSFLKVTEALSDETIKGMDSYHYKVEIDRVELKAALSELKSANIESLKITSEQLTSLNDMLDDTNLSKYPFEIWIAKDTKFVNQVAINVKEGSATVGLRLTFFDFNKPVEVQEPTGGKSLLDVLGSFMGVGTPTGASNAPLLEELQRSGISL